MKRYMAIAEIKVLREERQRRKIKDTSDLEASIQRIGLINPIVIDEECVLLAGERRLTACKNLGWEKIPVTFKNDLTIDQKHLLELDENLRREDLPWQDQAEAFLKAHEICGGTIENTAQTIGYDDSWVSRAVAVGRALRSDNPRIKEAAGINPAYNVLQRQEERAMSAELSNISSIISGGQEKPETTLPEKFTPVNIDCPIVCGDFIEFANTYSGKPFNFMHCDFPYGINHDKSDQGGAEQWGGYKDDPDTYWALCNALIANRRKLLLDSSHIMFWFSMNFYEETKAKFEAGGFTVQPFPLIWHKTDSKGILPDPTRGPRRVYETAFLMSSGDRKIIKAVDNTYGCPTSKALHLSEKPESMLRHFFRMLIDEFSEVLDPTCGSGNAVLAATRLGAKRVFGLELIAENASIAQTNFKKERQKDLAAERLQ